MLKSLPWDVKECSTKSGTQEWLLDHKKGNLFLVFDLSEKIKVQLVSGIYGEHSEPQCQKRGILPLSQFSI